MNRPIDTVQGAIEYAFANYTGNTEREEHLKNACHAVADCLDMVSAGIAEQVPNLDAASRCVMRCADQLRLALELEEGGDGEDDEPEVEAPEATETGLPTAANEGGGRVMNRFAGPVTLPRYFTLNDMNEGLRLVRREIDNMWRCARNLVDNDPDCNREGVLRELESAIYTALDNIHMVEGYVADVSKAEVNADSLAKGGPVVYPEVAP